MSENHSMSGFTEKVNGIVDQILELSLLNDCRAYFVVESSNDILTFNSEEDPLWPPEDRSLASLNRPLQRLYSFQEILARATREEQKDLTQMLTYISEVAKVHRALEANPAQEERALTSGDSEGPGADSRDKYGSV